MNKKQAREIYENAKPVKKLNDFADNDSYWIPAIKHNKIGQIKITTEEIANVAPPAFVIPHKLFNKFLGISIRSLDGSDRRIYNMYGLNIYTSTEANHCINDFRIDCPIITSEGVMDAEAVGLIYPYSFAIMGSVPSRNVMYSLSVLTNKIIHIPDNDEAGEKAGNIYRNKVNKLPFDIEYKVLNVPEKYNDPGDFMRQGNKNSVEWNSFKNKILTEVKL